MRRGRAAFSLIVRADNIHFFDTATALPHHLYATSSVLDNPTAKLSITREKSERLQATRIQLGNPLFHQKLHCISPEAPLSFITGSAVFYHKLRCVSPQAPLYFTTSSSARTCRAVALSEGRTPRATPVFTSSSSVDVATTVQGVIIDVCQ